MTTMVVDFRSRCFRSNGDHEVLRYGVTATEAGEDWSEPPEPSPLGSDRSRKPGHAYAIKKHFFNKRVEVNGYYQTEYEKAGGETNSETILSDCDNDFVGARDAEGGERSTEET